MATGGDELRPLAALRPHPRRQVVPAMAADEYASFLVDIAERRIQTPLEITAGGVVLDGHHRLRAAKELGLLELPVRVVEPENELAHMLQAALHRRHLNASQRAALTLELEVATLPTPGERWRDGVARIAGTSGRTLQDARTVREEDTALFERVKRGELPVHRAAKLVRRQRRLRSLPEAPAAPNGTFDLIYADPPWRSTNPGSEWSPEQHYPTMALEAIKALAVPAAADAVLFLWAVSSQLPEALEVVAAWDFSYRTSLVWVKGSIGMGSWVRHRHELLLVGRRGSFPPPEEPDRPDSVIEARRRRHSQKPTCVYELLERMYPQASKLELFARGKPRPGWNTWGNEVEAA